MRISVLSVCFLVLVSCAPNYSKGERVGVVTKLSRKGLFFKSWEGEMLVALPESFGGSIQPEKFEFNADESIVDALRTALVTGKRVQLVYRQWALCPWNIDNDHVVYAVLPVE